jgi:outer membrane usher protein
VRSPGVSDVTVENGTGVSTDWRGYAIVPYLTPYRRTTVRLDTSTLADNAEVDSSTAQVVPTEGAIVLAGFKTHIGARVLMHLHHASTDVPSAPPSRWQRTTASTASLATAVQCI